jgi:hypothetical protein
LGRRWVMVKALSFLEPWASLIAIGASTVDTRGRRTQYRGPLAIHVSKRLGEEAAAAFLVEPYASALAAAGIHDLEEFHPGCIIAVCELVDCQLITPESIPPSPQFDFGDFIPGNWAWHFARIRRLPHPIPAKGALGLWDPPIDDEGRLLL